MKYSSCILCANNPHLLSSDANCILLTQDTAGEARTNSSGMYSNGSPHMAKKKQDDQLKHSYGSYLRIRDVALKTCQKR